MRKNILLTMLALMPGSFFAAAAQTITLDYHFNREIRKNSDGGDVRFHYMWEDTTNTGFSIWGRSFTRSGARLRSLDEAPTLRNLKGTDIYIIVDPDTRKESANPNFIEQKDITQIGQYVKNGGVLVMMANDSANVELPHFNKLAALFGMHFNNDLHNHVVDDAHFNDGALLVKGDPLFKTAGKIFLKDICTIDISVPAKAVLSDKGSVIIATAKYGKGTVFAVGDPWLYNEYVNGRLPAGYENDKAANDIAQWLLKQIPAKRK